MRVFRLSTPLVLLMSLALLVLAGCSGSSDGAVDQSTDESAVEQSSDSEDQDEGREAQGATQEIDIASFAFAPAEVTVKAGTKIVWTNQDDANHQVHDDNGAFLSDIVGKGGTVEVDYSAPGTFTYHCHVHPNMKATIIVE